MSLTYTIRRTPAGDRIICLSDGRQVPAEIAAVAAGKDAWMRDITAKCRDCKQPFPLRELQGNGQWCEECATADIDD